MSMESAVASLQKAVERTLEVLGWRKRAYQLCFPKNQRQSDVILKDLAMYCHINEECPHTDLLKIGEWHGRRNVFLRIQRHLYLSPEELFAIYSGVRTSNKETQ